MAIFQVAAPFPMPTLFEKPRAAEDPMTEPLTTRTTEDTAAAGRRRVLLKLSGEVFGGGSVGVDPATVRAIAEQIAAVRDQVEVSVVVGGGNFFRGAELSKVAWTEHAPTTWACSAP